MRFVYPWMLTLVAFVPVAGAFWIFLRARAERRLEKIVAPSLAGRLLPTAASPLARLQMPLMVVGLTLVALAAAEAVDAVSRQYMNRLSDLLFVLARYLNHQAGEGDVAWQQTLD